MGVNHPGQGAAADLKRVQRNQGVATMQNSSISRANFTVRDGGQIIIENGGLTVTGTATISGTLTGGGTFTWTGPWNLAGPGTISGDVDVSGLLDVTGPTILRGTLNVTGNSAFGGTLDILGATALNSTLTVSSGQILAGAVTITPTGGGAVRVGTITIDGGGSTGGRVYSSSQLELTGASGVRIGGTLTTNDILALGKITAYELDVVGPKSFRMPHPTKPGKWIRHGSTESPVSGIEYWGEATIGAGGSVTVDLPDYFEALAKPENRTVLITGRGHSPDWSDIEDGKFTVTGNPGGRFSWLVKAERFGGDFLLEEELPDEQLDEG